MCLDIPYKFINPFAYKAFGPYCYVLQCQLISLHVFTIQPFGGAKVGLKQ